jgi:hypothetical protein
MTPNVPIMEIGTATLGMRLDLALRRNKNTTNVTSRTAITSVSSVSCSEARIVVLRSTAIATFMAAGMAAFRCGSSAFTLSIVSMMLAFGCRERMTSTEGSPLYMPRLRTSCTASCTSATSDSRTGAPLR